jgi:hypothetical protein
MSIIEPACALVALGFQRAMRMGCIILPSVGCPALQYFSTLSHKRHDFRKKEIVSGNKIYSLNFYITFVWNIFHSKKNWAGYDQKCIFILRESTRYSCPILMKLEFFSTDFRKILKYRISWKSVQREPSCFHTDRRTDTTKLIVCGFFPRNFANAPKNTAYWWNESL